VPDGTARRDGQTVGVSTMVSLFRLTFTGFDQRLASEFYAHADDADQVSQHCKRSISRVDKVLLMKARTKKR
jgi:hypothetical protein